MKVLIGTPIHQKKDYCMEQWIQNVSKLEYPADLLIVDNSLGSSYSNVVKGYCEKAKLKNYRIVHLELPAEQDFFERLARSRELIRNEILNNGYGAWFSWESDQIIPTNSLDVLVKLMKSNDFSIVAHNNWTREIPDLPNYDWGVTLINKRALEKYGFILEFGTDPDMPDTWEPSEEWFRQRVLRGGDSYMAIDGVIKPIYHLNE